MQKLKPYKIQCALSDVVQHVQRIVSDASSARVIRTSYTVTVETARRRYLFSDKATSKASFGAAGQLKRDVVASGVDPGNARPGNIAYYDVSDAAPSSCWCVDIRCAYPTALRKMGAITDDTFAMLRDMRDKSERLKVVGMLASRKFIQDYVGGQLVNSFLDEAPTAPFFYAACREIGAVMTALRQQCDGFVLFWVDGVFIDCDDPTPWADTLQSLGYVTKTERVTDIRRSFDGRYLFYTKSSKKTFLCLPRRVEYDDAELVTAIHNAVSL